MAKVTKSKAAAEGGNEGGKEGPVYFWKPHQGHGYLSQWFWTPFTVDGEVFTTTEMWMMVGKARLFGDEEIAKEILAADNPRKQKALGRKVRNFDEAIWDQHKLSIVEQGTYHKFTISEDAAALRAMLFATGERELVEASSMDRIWGVGFAEKNAGKNRVRWGQNLLGRALERVRRRLREEKERGSVRLGMAGEEEEEEEEE
ncbi:DUF1768-domain-containing protein [Bimuria novae-zelandiae CBS 107.79]|uniref:DUF1768-domain-containing protein n=1 Tax=Bimuria novae-zelandiae CBS 107.79 TaxID=1447943 RepID=A0A6A5V669_9PLEO|nr:DUF1768-domain-containing protein [Bimuria novae-zelandiae CBS 107.79]